MDILDKKGQESHEETESEHRALYEKAKKEVEEERERDEA